jgi:acetyl-CoA carboxylase carboxyltransferase component
MSYGDPIAITSPLVGTVISVIERDTIVRQGEVVGLIESMKMEYAVHAPTSGRVTSVHVAAGQAVVLGGAFVEIEQIEAEQLSAAADVTKVDSVASMRLEELRQREELLHDSARPDAVHRRRERGLRTARENVDDLIDPGSFVEYGRFAYAAQSRRRTNEDLIANTPGDGLIGGLATVNRHLFDEHIARCAVLSYDYMVLAGTQGQRNHRKKDRLFEVVDRLKIPVVFFTEGGGGRPGDTDNAVVTGLDTNAFHLFASLSGRAPLIGIAAGRCFAGNAALLGCCDVVIACEGASIGMGGPAMIAGGGLGVVEPDDVGPVAMHARAGSVDIVVPDEPAAVCVAQQLLALWQGTLQTGEARDQNEIRSLLPTDRRRVYDVRALIEGLFDLGSVVELRANFGPGMVTAFARVDGRAVAVLANNPTHLAGAIDANGADKAARFLQMADAWGVPVISLVDTPGFMVGPEAEATGLVRHVSRMFVVGASLRVPIISVITRRGYGLGAQAMCGGSFVAPILTVAWPQAELGGMGLEGAVRLGFRRELDAITDPQERERTLASLIDKAYENGRALNVAAHLEIDDVIDPAATRELLVRTLAQTNEVPRGEARFIDTW